MEILIDTHTHTIASGHAYSTVREMAQAAADKGLQGLVITDHGPEMPGGPHPYHFNCLRFIGDELFGVRVYRGAELNIIDNTGRLDLDERSIGMLEFVIAGMHVPCLDFGSILVNTKTLINCISQGNVHAISHPDDSRYPLNYEELAKAARDHHVCLEVNNTSLSPTGFRRNADENCLIMLEKCEKYNVSVIVSSDAHVFTDVGRFDHAKDLIQKVGFPSHLIVNRDQCTFEKFIQSKSQ